MNRDSDGRSRITCLPSLGENESFVRGRVQSRWGKSAAKSSAFQSKARSPGLLLLRVADLLGADVGRLLAFRPGGHVEGDALCFREGLEPAVLIAEIANTSLPPPSGVMKPKPFASLNDLTVLQSFGSSFAMLKMGLRRNAGTSREERRSARTASADKRTELTSRLKDSCANGYTQASKGSQRNSSTAQATRLDFQRGRLPSSQPYRGRLPASLFATATGRFPSRKSSMHLLCARPMSSSHCRLAALSFAFTFVRHESRSACPTRVQFSQIVLGSPVAFWAPASAAVATLALSPNAIELAIAAYHILNMSVSLSSNACSPVCAGSQASVQAPGNRPGRGSSIHAESGASRLPHCSEGSNALFLSLLRE